MNTERINDLASRISQVRSEPSVPLDPAPDAGTTDWETPVPLSRSSDLLVFPVVGLTDWLRAFVAAEAEATQTPVDMAAVFGLAAVASIAASHIEVEPVDGWREPVNLFVACAMDPGSRKSAVHRDVTAPVLEYEHSLVQETAFSISEAASIRRIAAAHLQKIEKQAASAKDNLERLALQEEARVAAGALERLDEPTPPRLFTDDATPEALATLLFQNKGQMAVLSAEGGIFDLMAGRYSNGIPNLDVYLKGHAGDPIRIDRKGRAPEYVERPALTVGVAVQPFVLVKAARLLDFGGRGLFDRFLFSMPAGNVGYRKTNPPPVPADIRNTYNTNLRALAATLEHGVTILRLTDDASAVLTSWRDELEPRRRPDGDLGHLQGWSSKLDGSTVRIAGLLHLADTYTTGFEKPIAGPTMAAAVDIARYFISHALAAFDHMGADPHLRGARRIVNWLAKEGRTTFTKRECHIALRPHFERSAELDPALALLADHGWIRLVPSEHRPGRPSAVYQVNPQLVPQNAQNARNSTP
jgi:replicative DNA helicase